MEESRLPRHALRPLASIALLALCGAALAQPAAEHVRFAGAWQRNASESEDPESKAGRREEAPDAEARDAARARGLAASTAWTEDVPLEVTVDSSHLEIADDGETVRVAYPSGRRRVFIADGEERELDDGDGPAKVTARRKAGASGDRLVVSSKWPSKVAMTETWEVTAAPRRLTIVTKVSARRSFTYRRVYEPASFWTPTPTASPTPVPSPTPAAGPPVPGATPVPGGMAECTIRPPRGAGSSELRALARISAADAEKRAVASVAPAKVQSVITSEPEVDDGCLVFPFDLRLEGKKGVQEVLIDAGDGKVLSSKFEAQ